MAGDSKAKVIPLHGNSGRAAAQRRAGQRTQGSRQHPSLLSAPPHEASKHLPGDSQRSSRLCQLKSQLVLLEEGELKPPQCQQSYSMPG